MQIQNSSFVVAAVSKIHSQTVTKNIQMIGFLSYVLF